MGRKADFVIDPQELHRMYIEEGMSTVAIAKQFKLKQPNGAWDAPRIQRLLNKYNINTRSKSEAQALALETGTAEHPTEGRERTVLEKAKMGVAALDRYANMSDAQKKEVTKGLRGFWTDDKKKDQQEATREKIGSQLRKAVVEGTYLEKAIAKFLIQQGYKVDLHVSEFLGTTLEADMVVSGNGVSMVLEIDGPRHWQGAAMGQDPIKLVEVIKADQKKNGLVLGLKGVWMVRILYPFSGKEVTYVKATLEKLHQILEHIRTMNRTGQTLKPQDRFIALDLGLVCSGKAVTNNPTFRQAMKILKNR